MRNFLKYLYAKNSAITQRGFGFVEFLVAMTVFSMLVIVVGNGFGQMITLQRRGFSAQKIQENTMFVLELMAREVRVSTVESLNYACVTGSDLATTLAITHPVLGLLEYRSADGIVYRREAGVETAISSQDVQFTKLYFCIKNASIDQNQSRVAIIAQVENTTLITKDKLIFNIQTTVASRDTSDELRN